MILFDEADYTNINVDDVLVSMNLLAMNEVQRNQILHPKLVGLTVRPSNVRMWETYHD